MEGVDGADGHALAVEHRALLDVQLDEAVEIGPSYRLRAGVADAPELVADGLSVDALGGQGLVEREPADIDEASHHVRVEAGAFLIGEESDDDRPLGLDRRLVQDLHHLEPGENAVVAVVAPAGADGVDVRSRHQWGRVVAPPASAEDIADGIDGDREPEVPHPADHQVAAVAVLIGEGEAGIAATLDRADLGQAVEPGQQADDVDPEIGAGHTALTSSPLRPTSLR